MAGSLETPKNVTVKAGENFFVKIGGTNQGSTGYHWEVVEDYPTENIRFVTKSWTPNNSKIGSEGIASFEFQAISPSTMEFKLEFVEEKPDSTVGDTLVVGVKII